MIEADRERTLSRAIALFARDEGLPVSWPGLAFDPAKVPGNADRDDGPNENLYLRVAGLPVPPDVRGITTGWSVYVFLQQISIYVRDGLGETPAFVRADALRTAFPFNRRLVGEHTYTVMAPATIAPPLQGDGWLSVPVTIRFQAIA